MIISFQQRHRSAIGKCFFTKVSTAKPKLKTSYDGSTAAAALDEANIWLKLDPLVRLERCTFKYDPDDFEDETPKKVRKTGKCVNVLFTHHLLYHVHYHWWG